MTKKKRKSSRQWCARRRQTRAYARQQRYVDPFFAMAGSPASVLTASAMAAGAMKTPERKKKPGLAQRFFTAARGASRASGGGEG